MPVTHRRNRRHCCGGVSVPSSRVTHVIHAGRDANHQIIRSTCDDDENLTFDANPWRVHGVSHNGETRGGRRSWGNGLGGLSHHAFNCSSPLVQANSETDVPPTEISPHELIPCGRVLWERPEKVDLCRTTPTREKGPNRNLEVCSGYNDAHLFISKATNNNESWTVELGTRTSSTATFWWSYYGTIPRNRERQASDDGGITGRSFFGRRWGIRGNIWLYGGI